MWKVAAVNKMKMIKKKKFNDVSVSKGRESVAISVNIAALKFLVLITAPLPFLHVFLFFSNVSFGRLITPQKIQSTSTLF